MNTWQRASILFLSACGAAAVLGLLANAANLGIESVYALGGVLIGVVGLWGLPLAFGWRVPGAFENGRRVHAEEAAVSADKRHTRDTAAEPKRLVVTLELHKSRFIDEMPGIDAAERAGTRYFPLVEGLAEAVEVRHTTMLFSHSASK